MMLRHSSSSFRPLLQHLEKSFFNLTLEMLSLHLPSPMHLFPMSVSFGFCFYQCVSLLHRLYDCIYGYNSAKACQLGSYSINSLSVTFSLEDGGKDFNAELLSHFPPLRIFVLNNTLSMDSLLSLFQASPGVVELEPFNVLVQGSNDEASDYLSSSRKSHFRSTHRHFCHINRSCVSPNQGAQPIACPHLVYARSFTFSFLKNWSSNFRFAKTELQQYELDLIINPIEQYMTHSSIESKMGFFPSFREHSNRIQRFCSHAPHQVLPRQRFFTSKMHVIGRAQRIFFLTWGLVVRTLKFRCWKFRPSLQQHLLLQISQIFRDEVSRRKPYSARPG